MADMKRNTVRPTLPESSGSMRNYTMTTEDLSKDSPLQLHQARWAAHRKKIGLSRRSEQDSHLMQNSYDKIKQELVAFVKSTFRRKECIKFVPKYDPKRQPNDPIKCYCGERPEKHTDGAEGVEEFFNLGADTVAQMLEKKELNMTWNKETDIQEFKTNAFGKIDFQYEGLGGRKPSKYIRLKDDTPVDCVLMLLKEFWHINRPKPANLVITVIGGAKNFKLDGKKKEVFNRGLVNAAQTTNAWIITSGCNMGVMRAVGEAVADAQSYTYDQNGMSHTLKCIGIAPWGYVLDADPLIKSDGTGSWNATYKPSKVIKHGSPVSLNPNHTHFLLVDDGLRNMYGGVADFRARLESKLALPINPGPGQEAGCGIPVVLVVVEGGYDAISDVSRSIKAKIPCVICEGTGRAADILAYAYSHFVTTRDGKRVMKQKHQLILEDKLLTAYGKTWTSKSDEKKEAAKFLKIVMDSCQDENLMTVFDMNKDEEMDLAILSALLKGQGAKNLDQLHDQLRLALTWNRTDIAEEEIFTLDITWPSGSLNDIMTDALVDDKVGFVRLLLQNGLIMEEYLTAPRLRMLYNKIPKTHHLREMLQNKTKYHFFTLKDIARLLVDLLDKFTNDTYMMDTNTKAISKNLEASLAEGNDKLDNPFKELFLWAVLMNRQELAKFLWERGCEAIPSAIAASKIFDSMIKRLQHFDSDLKSIYQKNKDEFELLAVRVLDECNTMDPEKAAMLIERKYSGWGDMDCLEMAAQAQDREFLSAVCCQNSLSLMWKRGISSHSAMIPLCLVLPPLIFVAIKFQSLGDKNEKLSARQKLLTFFRAPVTKFSAHLMMYLFFLVLFSYMILFGYRARITPTEWVVIAWLTTITLEELREMFLNSMADTVKQRLNLWWNFSVFNRVDALVIILAILAIVLRFVPNVPVTYPKNVYSIMGVFLFVRVLREYSASSSLGPKLVMINQMLRELIFFMMILVVFLLAYGISSQALMHPLRDFSPIIFRDILYYPYWQVYGELYLEELEGRTDGCRNATVDENGELCPTFSWLVIILTAGYLLVGNLLLLNILIAIFNNVFNEIHVNSIQVWKYGLYFLVVEYDNKPTLAPPFIVFEHIFMIIRWICRRTCCKIDKHVDTYSRRQTEILQTFEKEMVRGYTRHRQLEVKDTINNHIVKIHNRVDEMAKMLEEERLLEQQHFEAEQNRQQEKSSSHHRGHTLQQSPSANSLATSVSDPDLASQDAPRKFSRWPSIDAIKELKARMEGLQAIPEALSGAEPAVDGMIGSLPLDETGRYSTSPDQMLHITGYTESETDTLRQPRSRADTPDHKPPIVSKLQQPTHTTHKPSGKPDEAEHTSSSRKRSKSRKRSSKNLLDVSSDLLRGLGGATSYQELSEESASSSDRDHLKLSPMHRAMIERRNSQLSTAAREPQGNSDSVQSKLESLDQRLAKLEDTTQKSLYNIETLLRNAVFQRGPVQLVAPSRPDSASSLAQGMSVNQIPISVPPPVHPYRSNDGTEYTETLGRDAFRVAPEPTGNVHVNPPYAYQSFNSRALPPTAAPLSYTRVDTRAVPPSAVPPTYPPSNAFGSFDDVL